VLRQQTGKQADNTSRSKVTKPKKGKNFMRYFATLCLLFAKVHGDKWDHLREGLDAWASLSFDAKFGVNIGDESGTLFTWKSEGFSMSDYHMRGASLSKWPSAGVVDLNCCFVDVGLLVSCVLCLVSCVLCIVSCVLCIVYACCFFPVMISGLVADGTMSYDDKANKYLKWWPKDPSDVRSEITLRHLLSFTSGFLKDSEQLYRCRGGFEQCAEAAFNNYTKKEYQKPGTTWQYLSVHLQFAGAMAVVRH
jgi:hypothetical protein